MTKSFLSVVDLRDSQHYISLHIKLTGLVRKTEHEDCIVAHGSLLTKPGLPIYSIAVFVTILTRFYKNIL